MQQQEHSCSKETVWSRIPGGSPKEQKESLVEEISGRFQIYKSNSSWIVDYRFYVSFPYYAVYNKEETS